MTNEEIQQQIEDDYYRYAEPKEAVWEESEYRCPDCNSIMMKYPAQTSPDDYSWVLECPKCGTTITE
jgi:hypothetical protein